MEKALSVINYTYVHNLKAIQYSTKTPVGISTEATPKEQGEMGI